jgi:cobyrinic acid a,c-diamide synthase
VGQAGLGSDLVIIDGHAGLFDPHGDGPTAMSDAEIARLSNTPCVLVIDTIEVAESIAAQIAGFSNFAGAPHIAAVILNGLEQRELGKPLDINEEVQRCNEILSRYGLPPCIGCIPARGLQSQCPPADILQQANCTALPLQFIKDVEELIVHGVDLDALVVLAQAAPHIEYESIDPVVSPGKSRIAVASDNCFHVCYQDNLDLLRMHGAELVKFSPLADSSLPRGIGGVYLPGACLGEYAQDVENNPAILAAIADFVRHGGILYSEGAGSAILCKSFKPAGCDRAYRGAGLIPFEVSQEYTHAKLADVSVLDGSALGAFGESARALLTDNWRVHNSTALQDATSGVMPTLRFESGHGEALQEGYSVSAESCSTFNFLHFGSNPRLARALVEASAIHQRATTPAKR